MPGFRFPRRREVQEATAVFGREDSDSGGTQEEEVFEARLQELETRDTLEREDVKPSRCSRTLKLLPLLSLQLFACFSLAFTAPYIPRLALENRLERWQFTIMASSSKVTMLLGTLLNIVVIQRLKPHITLVLALIGMIASMGFYGCVYWVHDVNAFVGATSLIGILFGFVQAFFIVTLYATATYKNQQSCGIIISAFEFLYGACTSIGSLSGIALIDLWAHPVPYFITAGLMLLGLLILIFASPGKSFAVPKDQADQNSFRLLGNAPMIGNILNVTIIMAALGFHDGTLEIHLKEEEFRLPDEEVGAVFTVLHIFYAVGALFWGYVFSYRLEKEHTSAFLGFVMVAVAFLILGPAPFLPFPPHMWLIYISQVLTGLGASAVIICSFSLSIKKSIERGFPDNMWTYGSVCGFLFFAIVLGSSISPPLSRYIMDTIGYGNATMVLLAFLCFCVLLSFISCVSNSRRRGRILQHSTPKGVYHKREDP
ncbi:uncharacterized protein LOC121048099 [Ixodes scapularis]|uniref:uncharacterized protein LOC121048099 n=1 Tax=Ixodes scapularis TaxID=6945 RepID=UPI001C3834D0|nr:uncharacterized protein LOC121048099 [Ixodes scapularis]